jgi:hypothetical protein
MPPRRSHRSDPAHLAFRASVTLALGAGHGNRVAWSASHGAGMPYVRNLAELADSPAFHGIDTDVILLNTSAKTALELADGNWAGVLHASQPPGQQPPSQT